MISVMEVSCSWRSDTERHGRAQKRQSRCHPHLLQGAWEMTDWVASFSCSLVMHAATPLYFNPGTRYTFNEYNSL